MTTKFAPPGFHLLAGKFPGEITGVMVYEELIYVSTDEPAIYTVDDTGKIEPLMPVLDMEVIAKVVRMDPPA